MWVLEHKDKDEWRYITSGNNKSKYVVGRVSADIVLPTDSISRQHAIFYIENYNELFIEDNNSKYGTFINGGDVRLSAGEKHHLSNGDFIHFGVLQSNWILRRHDFNCLSSTLTATEQQTLEAQLLEVGGRLEEKPHAQCTHLTMPKCSLTPKLLYALIKNIPIVNCEYWSDLLSAVRECRKLPKVENYRPQSDSLDLKPKVGRTQLFKHRIFIFMDERMLDTYKPIVEASSGTVGELEVNNYKEQVLKSNAIVMEYLATSPSQNSELFNKISEYLISHGRRSIPDYEIAMAIMHCNTESWCNPDYLATPSMPTMAVHQMQQKCREKDSEEILLPETNEEFSNAKTQIESLSNIRVTESQNEKNESIKRKREEFFIDDSDDDELGALNFEDFQVETARESNINSPTASAVDRPQTPPPMPEKHNPIYVKGLPAVAAYASTNKKIRLSDDSEKKKITEKAAFETETETKTGTEIEKQKHNAERKSTRIAILTDDADKGNLFCFSKPTKRQKQQKPVKNTGKTELVQSTETVADYTNCFNLVSSTQKSCRMADIGTKNSEYMRSSSPKAKKPYAMVISTHTQFPKRIHVSSWISFSEKKSVIKIEKMDTATSTSNTDIEFASAADDKTPMRIVKLNIKRKLSNNTKHYNSTIGTENNAKLFKVTTSVVSKSIGLKKFACYTSKNIIDGVQYKAKQYSLAC